jgi:hypothetical protein
MAFEDLRGRDGNVVISKSRVGLVLRPYTIPVDANTADQRTIRGYFGKAAATFKELGASQVTAWEQYASTLSERDPVTGETYSPTAINVYVGLGTKYLQVTPGGILATDPPTGSFEGDTLVITASGGPNQVTFSAGAANATGVTTELLLQRLASKNREPFPYRYDSQAFHVFTSSPTPQVVDAPEGWYAAAYRFVELATGRATGIYEIPGVLSTLSMVQDQAKRKAPRRAKASARKKAA